MCLILFAWRVHPVYRLVLAANRDEYYERPTAPASFWEDEPDLLAGRDLRAGGTWFGVTRRGRIAGITNYRDPGAHNEHAPSRGRLITDFLRGAAPADVFLERVAARAPEYNGFNLVLGDLEKLYWYSNRGGDLVALGPGVYGVSNRLLDTPWQKVVMGKERLVDAMARCGRQEDLIEGLLDILSDRQTARDEDLPETGVGREWERVLSSIFIESPGYGTRSSMVLLVRGDGEAYFAEKTHAPDQTFNGRIVRHVFRMDPAAAAEGGLHG